MTESPAPETTETAAPELIPVLLTSATWPEYTDGGCGTEGDYFGAPREGEFAGGHPGLIYTRTDDTLEDGTPFLEVTVTAEPGYVINAEGAQFGIEFQRPPFNEEPCDSTEESAPPAAPPFDELPPTGLDPITSIALAVVAAIAIGGGTLALRRRKARP